MERRENISFRIPTDSSWGTNELEEKANKYNESKSVFAFEAVDIVMNFEDEIYQRINKFSKGLHVPKWLVMQNMLIKELAKRHADQVVNGKKSKVLEEFQVDGNEDSCEMVTGKKLFDRLVDRYTKDLNQKKAEAVKSEKLLANSIRKNKDLQKIIDFAYSELKSVENEEDKGLVNDKINELLLYLWASANTDEDIEPFEE